MKMKKDHRDIGKIGWEHMENNKHSSMNFNTKKLTGFFIMLVCMTYIVYSLNIFLLGNYSCGHCMTCRGNCTEKKAVIIVMPNVTRSFPRKNANVTFVLQQKGNRSENTTTDLGHIVFGIAASAKLWNRRKDYLRIWWRSNEMRGYVWLDTDVLSGKNDDKNDNSTFPPIMISQETTKFQYTNRQGHRSALRISRIVSETFRLGLPDVHWFVMGDDDTVFVTDNLVRVLSKYDHREMYYIGSLSESHLQNIHFSYNMAYGGGGFAISYPLAKALEKMQDGCIQRYPGLYGSDDRIQACMAELGVPLTKELGFHQCDIYGNLFGLLTAHPVTPLVSLHHLDVVEPIFPKVTRVQAMQHLFKVIELDSAGVLQQSICYDRRRQWSISISWGYAVQIYRGIFRPRDLEMPSRTFLNWYRRADYTAYAFNTRPVTRHPCQKPFVFFRKGIHYNTQKDTLTSNYTRHDIKPPKCRWRMASPESIEWIQVIKKHQNYSISQAPRRNCCRVLSSKQTNIKIQVSYCKEGEIIAI